MILFPGLGLCNFGLLCVPWLWFGYSALEIVIRYLSGQIFHSRCDDMIYGVHMRVIWTIWTLLPSTQCDYILLLSKIIKIPIYSLVCDQ